MDKYVVEWRSNVPKSDWEVYPWLPAYEDVAIATREAVQAAIDAIEWYGNKANYEFRVRHTTTEFIKIEV